MQSFKGFPFHKPSVDLSQVEDFRFCGGSHDVTPSYGKTVRIYQTQDLQIVGVPPELTRVLPYRVLNRDGGIKSTVTCHFETYQGFSLLRAQMMCHMARQF